MGIETRWRWLKVTLATAIILLVAGFVAAFSIGRHYENIIKQKLPVWVASATDSLYQITVYDVSLNIITRKVTLADVRLWPNEERLRQLRDKGTLPKTTFTLRAPAVSAEKIKWTELLADKELSCGKFKVHTPEVIVTELKPDSVVKPEIKRKPSIRQISAKTIEIVGANVIYRNPLEKDALSYAFQGGLVVLKDWLYHPDMPNDTNRLMYAKDATIMIDSMVFSQYGSIYGFQTGAIYFSTDNNTFTVNNVKFKPTIPKEEFNKRIQYQQDIYSCSFPDVKMEGFDWKKALYDRALIARRIILKEPKVRIYRSRVLPVDPNKVAAPYPHQCLLLLHMPVNVDSVEVENGYFRYTELNATSLREGYFQIDKVTGGASNITNMPERIARKPTIVINLTGRFMRESPLRARFDLNLTDTTGKFVVTGRLDTLHSFQIGRVSKVLALAEIRDGEANNIDFHIEGDQTGATSVVRMPYKDLKIKVQKMEKGQLKSKFFVSLFLNQELIYNDNPVPGQALRVATGYFKKPRDRGFFNLLWKSSLNSVTKVVAKSEKVSQMLK